MGTLRFEGSDYLAERACRALDARAARSPDQLETYCDGHLSAHSAFVPWWFPAVVQFRRDKEDAVYPIMSRTYSSAQARTASCSHGVSTRSEPHDGFAGTTQLLRAGNEDRQNARRPERYLPR